MILIHVVKIVAFEIVLKPYVSKLNLRFFFSFEIFIISVDQSVKKRKQFHKLAHKKEFNFKLIFFFNRK